MPTRKMMTLKYKADCGTEDFTFEEFKDFQEYSQSISQYFTFEVGHGWNDWDFWDIYI
jgi:hypothetical protein